MIYAAPGASFETEALQGGPGTYFTTGLVGTIGARIDDGQGATVVARQTTGIVEEGSAIYVATLTAPSTAGTYLVIWDDGSGHEADGGTLVVTANIPSPPRSTMTDLVARLRLMVADPTSSPTFTDAQLQDYLDARRTDRRYEELDLRPSYTPGGGTTYQEYYAETGWWEADEQLVSGQYAVLTPATSDRVVGHWTFGASQNPPVLITGKTYDLNSAAADVLEAWAAIVKLDFDFKADDQSFSRSQKVKALMDLAATFRRRGSARSVHLRRSDQPGC